MELPNISGSPFRGGSYMEEEEDDELQLQWAAIERLPTFKRLRTSLLVLDNDLDGENGGKESQEGKRVTDVTKLGALERQLFIHRLIKHIENDNLKLLQKIRDTIDRVNVKLPTVEVRFQNLSVEAGCEIVQGKPLPTLWNSLISSLSLVAQLMRVKSQRAKMSILKDVCGIIKPSRLTLLLGPPGSGKTTMLLALSGRLDQSLKLTGEISYNGYKLDEFVPQKTSAYISQYDLHIPVMTVRETIDFSARCQGVGSRADIMMEVIRREKEAGIVPDPDVDTYMKAIAAEGQERNMQTDYVLKILGLNACANILAGSALRRGVSGGQRKRLSTEGKIVYQGPRSEVLQFFEDCGFKCPERKGVADFLQEVISEKDQALYWYHTDTAYKYVSVDQFSQMFKASSLGEKLNEKISKPYDKTFSHKSAISFTKYSLSKWELFKSCLARELLLMKRNSFVYVFKTLQLVITAVITMTVFIRTEMKVDLVSANYLMGSMFYTLVRLMLNGAAELTLTIIRLSIIYMQRALYMYPAWAYSIPASILKIPLSLADSIVWTSLTYYVIGYSPEVQRFFSQLLVLFAVHLASTSLCRFIAVIFQTMVVGTTVGSVLLLLMFIFGGFIIPQPSIPRWLRWGFWLSPTTYGEIGISLTEFLAPRWQKAVEGNTTTGNQLLTSHGLDFDGSFFWISVGALLGLTLLFDFGFALALTFLDRNPKMSRAIVSKQKFSQPHTREEGRDSACTDKDPTISGTTEDTREKRRMALPFEPLSVAFKDVQYFVGAPVEMRKHGFTEKKLQLLHDISGAFRPGILTALMGVSGAGKTTLLDVLSGRKSYGMIEGDIRIGGYPKVQKTFARISGYCEQNDIHSPQVTVEESIMYSAWLRLPPETEELTRQRFVQDVIETIELDDIRDSLVGIPGQSGLPIEQRKRLTIAVELVSNPSVIFMDEPTSGLDARAAAIVMRAVKNVVSTGRTVVCTIHQPSIHVFEAFDELILMKTGGQIIYSGNLGHHSSELIAYFKSIPGVPKIEDNYNPATWMLEVTSASMEAKLGLDFANIYKESSLHKNTLELVERLSQPEPGSKDLHFSTTFPQSSWMQFKACLWKQHLSYWRSPEYNLTRFIFTIILSIMFGTVFWQRAQQIHNEQDLSIIFGSMYIAVIFLGTNNGSTVLPYVATERTVLYREQFAGMYSSWAYSFAQVTTEIPYVMSQAVLFTAVTYPAIGYYWSASKVFWYFHVSFCTFLYFVYLGMLLMSISSTLEAASILSAAVYTLLNLFSGFLIPGPKIPKWWIWCYWICPSSWSLNGLLTSQYGDVEKEISIFGEPQRVDSFLGDFYGFHHDRLGLVAAVLMAFPLIFASLFACYVGKLNFQRR